MLWGQWVHALMDNVSDVSSLKQPGGARSKSLLHVLALLILWAKRGVLGIQADYLSLSCVDHNAWSLTDRVFGRLVAVWGLPKRDLMATFGNQRVPRFL